MSPPPSRTPGRRAHHSRPRGSRARAESGTHDRQASRPDRPCASVDDVATALRFAAEHELPLAVVAGHNVAGTAVVDDGMSSTSRPCARSASTTRGGPCTCRRRHVGRRRSRHGAARAGHAGGSSRDGCRPGAHGGVSSQRRLQGMTIDKLVSAESSADGAGPASATSIRPYWALRGGGRQLRRSDLLRAGCTSRPRGVLSRGRVPDRGRGRVLAGWRDAVAGAPDELSTAWFVWSMPVIPELPEHLRGRAYVASTACTRATAEGERLTRPCASSPPVAGHERTVATSTSSAPSTRSSRPGCATTGRRSTRRARGLRDRHNSRVVLNRRRSARSWSSPWRRRDSSRGRGRRVRGPQLGVDAEHRSTWDTRTTTSATSPGARLLGRRAPLLTGETYFNFPGLLEEGDGGVRESYGANYDRLAQVKAMYDSENVFRLNQNIRPQSA